VREEVTYSWLQRLAIAVLRTGALPRHVAFIMDGNRRFARHKGSATIEGHRGGFHKLAETLQWCRRLGVKEVTVYAFSIENFRRSEEEVAELLKLATEKLQALAAEAEELREHGVRVRVLGELAMLPEELRRAAATAELLTRDNDQCCLNVALAYTSRQEMVTAVRRAAELVRSGELGEEEVTEEVVGSLLYTATSHPVDLLVRTSGETRLSDFLLWQASSSILNFTTVLWPDFSLWHLLAAVFHYQRHRRLLEEVLEEEVQEEQDVQGKSLEVDAAVATLLGGLVCKTD